MQWSQNEWLCKTYCNGIRQHSYYVLARTILTFIIGTTNTLTLMTCLSVLPVTIVAQGGLELKTYLLTCHQLSSWNQTDSFASLRKYDFK